MGRLPSENRKYQLSSLNDLHHESIRLTLLGWKPKQIAEWLGVTEPTVHNAVNSARGRQQLSLLRAVRDGASIDLAKEIAEFAPQAFEMYKTALLDENLAPALKLKYSLEAVGLAGHVKPQRVQVQAQTTHLTLDEIQAIKARAQQLAIEHGSVDAEYVELEQPKEKLSSLLATPDEEQDTNCRARDDSCGVITPPAL